MSKLKVFILYYLPPIIWMTLIFYFSSRVRVEVSEKYILNFIFFKSLHVIEYAILYFLIFRALFTKTKAWQDIVIYTTLISILYAVSDEIHQTFVPTREGKIRDVFIDSLGVTLMYIYIRHNLKWLKKYFLR